MVAAYVPRQGGSKTKKICKKRLYTTLRTINNASSTPQEMRIAKMWPQSDCQKIWENVTTASISEADGAVWYRAIHDILSTNETLHRIKKSPTDGCKGMWQERHPHSPFNPLTPNDNYIGRTAPLTSKRYILYIYSTNIGTGYFKHGIYSPSFLFKIQFVS